MATTTFTPSMLRGAGARGVPEIPAFTSSTSSVHFFDALQANYLGANAETSTWPITISASGTEAGQVASYSPSNLSPSFAMEIYVQSGRGGTSFRNSRIYLASPKLGGSNGVPGTITAANISLPVSKSLVPGKPDTTYGSELGIFLGSTGSVSSGNPLTGTVTDYPFYFSESISNKTAFSPFQEVTENTILTYPLNSTAITALNTSNNSSIASERVNFAVVWENDFEGVAPTGVFKYSLSVPASLFPNDPAYNDGIEDTFVPPYIEFIYTPD